MTRYPRSTRSLKVREPVQVYLDGPDQARLERLTGQLDSTKSDVLRRGLQALEQQLSDPSGHPALRITGIVNVPEKGAIDPARDHDHWLAQSEEDSWSDPDVG